MAKGGFQAVSWYRKTGLWWLIPLPHMKGQYLDIGPVMVQISKNMNDIVSNDVKYGANSLITCILFQNIVRFFTSSR